MPSGERVMNIGIKRLPNWLFELCGFRTTIKCAIFLSG